MITTNVFQRTFHIRYGDFTGTAFAIDRTGRQYLVTAKHVVPDIETGRTIDIFHDKQWKTVPIMVVGVAPGEVDIVVLGCPVQLAPPYPLDAASAGLIFGQVIYFLGFPFGWDSGAENINRDFPVPFVKAGILSAFQVEEPKRIYIDAHGNQGFSGGPVVFKEPGQRGNEFKVAGVVANAPTPLLTPVVNDRGEPIEAEGKPVAFFRENQGIVVAHDIQHATDLIDANPVGFELPPDEVS